MSEKGLKLLLGVFAVAVLIWLAVSYLPRGSGGPAAPTDALASFFSGVTPEEVRSVRFLGPGDAQPTELTRSEGAWRVNGFRADSANLARFWTALEDAQVGDLVASNPANHSRLGVSGDSVRTVEIHLSSEVRTLLVGKGGTSYGTAFVRLPDEDAVFILEGNLRPHLTRTVDDWRDKRVARVDTSAAYRIEVEGEEDRFVLERSDSLWVLEGGEETNGTTVRGILSELARMDASGFYGPADSLTALGGTLRTLTEAGDTLIHLEMGSGEGDRWVRVRGDTVTYRVASWRAPRLFPELESVRSGG